MNVALLQAEYNRKVNANMSNMTETLDDSRIETNSTCGQSGNGKKNEAKKRVTFNLDNNTVHDVPKDEDRFGMWMIISDIRRVFEHRNGDNNFTLGPIVQNRACVSYV